MINVTSKENLAKMVFSDDDVLSVIICEDSNSITINMSGASYMENQKRMDIGKGYIKISNYNSMKITSYNAIRDEQINVKIGEQEMLDMLCEIILNGNTLKLTGFAKGHANWLEFIIEDGNLECEFHD